MRAAVIADIRAGAGVVGPEAAHTIGRRVVIAAAIGVSAGAIIVVAITAVAKAKESVPAAHDDTAATVAKMTVAKMTAAKMTPAATHMTTAAAAAMTAASAMTAATTTTAAYEREKIAIAIAGRKRGLRGSGKCAGNDQGRSERGSHKATR
ncbi:MAG: hypothetical protein QOD94_3166, partial [Alphaproteobacteria bacterium]|nr:hypothetical protein [Alphaproteobacteria bacterium]